MKIANKLSILGLVIAMVGIAISVFLNKVKVNPKSITINKNIVNMTEGEGSHIINNNNGDINIRIINK